MIPLSSCCLWGGLWNNVGQVLSPAQRFLAHCGYSIHGIYILSYYLLAQSPCLKHGESWGAESHRNLPKLTRLINDTAGSRFPHQAFYWSLGCQESPIQAKISISKIAPRVTFCAVLLCTPSNGAQKGKEMDHVPFVLWALLRKQHSLKGFAQYF